VPRSKSPLALVVHADPASRTLIEAQVLATWPKARLKVCQDGPEALEWSHIQAPDVVIAAAQIGNMTGLELFRALRARPPAARANCVLVDADADAASVRAAVPLGLLAYLTRPLSAELLGRRLLAASATVSSGVPVSPNEDLETYLERVRNDNSGAPLLSDVQAAVGQSLKAGNLDLAELEAMFACEPQITARLISEANSAAHYQGTPCQSVAQALSRLGIRRVLNLVVSIALQRNARLADPRLASRALEVTEQARRAAELALWFARRLRLDGESCYTAGLLQNIGELALLRALQGWIDRAEGLDEPTIDRVMATRAAGFGSALRAHWRLPLGLRQLIAAYYGQGAGVFSQEALILDLTHRLVDLPAGTPPSSLADERTVRMLGIDPQLLDEAPLRFAAR